MGDLAERDPFYFLKSRQKLDSSSEDQNSPLKQIVDQKRVVKSLEDSNDYMRFVSPHDSIDEDEPEEENYGRRQYYGLVPIDGFTFSHKLNSVSKRFLVKLLNDHRYNKKLMKNLQATKVVKDNDADFREVVKEILETETLA
jgi:hypothetical protein